MKFILGIIIIMISLDSLPQNVLATFEVKAGNYDRRNTPVSVSLEGITYTHDSLDLILEEITGSGKFGIPCQLEMGYSSKLWWILSGITKSGKTRTFQLSLGVDKNPDLQIKIKKTEKGTILLKDDQKLIQYNHGTFFPPDGIDPIFAKSGFIHPLWAPGGDTLTRIQPPDHYHHYGIWGPYTRTRFEGHNTDFWNLAEGQGTVVFSKYGPSIEGPVYSEINALQDHIDYQAKGADKTALIEELSIRIWNIENSLIGKVYLWDYTTTISCATESPVELFSYRYGGGIGFRAHESWKKENSSVLTSEGLNRDKADGTRARWCDITVTQAGSHISGILFMSNPNNRQHPEPMRVWPLDANANRGDMFFEFCPIRHESWIIEPGKAYALKYRMLVHDGVINAQEAERYWIDFAEPPVVRRVR